MEVLESGEQSVLQWDRKLSELSEPGDSEALMYHTMYGRVGKPSSHWRKAALFLRINCTAKKSASSLFRGKIWEKYGKSEADEYFREAHQFRWSLRDLFGDTAVTEQIH